MSSFFKTTFFNDREKIIKQSLITYLNNNTKEIQYEQLVKDETLNEFGASSDHESLNSLCTTLEAIFLHGLKNSFLSRVGNVLGGAEDEKPEPNFWPPLLIITHQNTIKQIQGFSQLNSEIGYCRAWIRQSLNDTLFSSYLKTIRSNRSALEPYYNKYAFIRDSEALEISEKLMSGVETCITISLPCNSSIFNQWPNQPLEISGLWSPPLRSVPIAQGYDISQSLGKATPMQIPKQGQKDFCAASISNSPFRTKPNVILNKDELGNLYLETDDAEVVLESDEPSDDLAQIVGEEVPTSDKKLEDQPLHPTETDEIVKKVETTPAETNPSSNYRRSVSTENDNFSDTIDELQSHFVASTSDSMTTSCDRLSYTAEDFQRLRKSSISRASITANSYSCLFSNLQQQKQNTTSPDIDLIFKRFEANCSLLNDSESAEDKTAEPADDDFVVLPTTIKFTMDELHHSVSTLCVLANEQGLKNQDFSCKDCANPLGVGLENAQVCAFDGYYYCNACMSQDQLMIPAKIIYNWDFRRYAVSKKAATFLTDYSGLPFIDLKILNPDIYSAINEMYLLQKLRIQFNFIRAFLFNCDKSQTIMETFKKHLYARAYLYESIHQYSIGDFDLIKTKSFEPLLKKNIEIGKIHILNCALCSQKGFICEICQNPEVLYPFDVETTFRCQECASVYHVECLNDLLPCPKCARIAKRLQLTQGDLD